MTYILYNPIAGGGSGKEKAEEVSRKIQPEMSRPLDVTTLDLHAFFEEIPCTEAIVLAAVMEPLTVLSIDCMELFRHIRFTIIPPDPAMTSGTM